MTDSSHWERAEAALGHVQQAASEMIAAAHDALDLLDGVVSTADLGEVFHTFSDLSRSLFNRARSSAGPQPSSGPTPDPGERAHEQPPARPHSPVQRISVR